MTLDLKNCHLPSAYRCLIKLYHSKQMTEIIYEIIKTRIDDKLREIDNKISYIDQHDNNYPFNHKQIIDLLHKKQLWKNFTTAWNDLYNVTA